MRCTIWNNITLTFSNSNFEFQLKRYKTYYYLLSSRMNSDQSLDFETLLTMGDGGVLMGSDEILQRNRQNAAGIVVGGGGFGSAGANQAIIQQQPLSQQQFQQQITGAANATTTGNSVTTGGSVSNRYSYRAAIYRSEAQQDLGWRVMGVFSACVV